uniref:Kelch-like family member 31 n=1 Tax=Eptatretus burgeri TaxID=7764 RepID=A0A8C4R4H2_EPTBU
MGWVFDSTRSCCGVFIVHIRSYHDGWCQLDTLLPWEVLPKSDMPPKKKTNRKNKADGNDVQIINGIKETAKNEINFLNNNFDFKELCSSVTELSNPHHSDQILEGQKAMQMDGFLCDLTLSVKTKTFHVHKLVMASCSDHIRTLLRQDSGTQQLELNDIAAVGLATAILYTYSGSVNLSLQNVSSVVATAVRLQMHSLLKLCCDFMEQTLNVENCMYVSNVAKTFDLHNTRETAEKFIRENFVEFSETDQFLKLSFDQINQLLLDDSLEINSELTAFHIALKWLEHDSKRLAYAAELLSNIRFGTISAHDLVTYVQTVPRMMQDPDCHKLLVDAMNYHLLPYQQNVMQSRRTKLRGGAKVLVTVGGRPALVEKSLSRDVLYRDPETGWVKLTEMVSKSFNQCIAVMDGFLYVAGGEDQNDARNQAKHAVSTFCRFDARFNMWIQLAGMLHKRTHFSFSACNGLLFAIGGRNSEGPLSAMECYVPSTNQWQPKASLDVARCCHASATANGRVLVTGGYINNAYSRTACSYEVTSDSWHEKAPLSTPRGWHCSVSLGERVYVGRG